MQKLKISIFDDPLIVNKTFSQTKFIIGKYDFAHIMGFQYTKRQILVKFEIISCFVFNFQKQSPRGVL